MRAPLTYGGKEIAVENGDEVWIVTHDDSLNDPILAVCATQDEAQHIMAEIAPRFPDGSVSLVAFGLST